MLHLANIPPESSSDDGTIVRGWFECFGNVLAFKFFDSDRRMALVQMASVDEAVTALTNLHNQEHHGKHLRVSFSKSSIAPIS
jgi:hypothetical protein